MDISQLDFYELVRSCDFDRAWESLELSEVERIEVKEIVDLLLDSGRVSPSWEQPNYKSSKREEQRMSANHYRTYGELVGAALGNEGLVRRLIENGVLNLHSKWHIGKIYDSRKISGESLTVDRFHPQAPHRLNMQVLYDIGEA